MLLLYIDAFLYNLNKLSANYQNIYHVYLLNYQKFLPFAKKLKVCKIKFHI